MDRNNHYESAYAAYLRTNGMRFLPTDETRRIAYGCQSVKTLDFVVLANSGLQLIIDVKGRKFPGGSRAKPRRVWESWAEREDVESLQAWTGSFGEDAVGLLTFVYHLQPWVKIADETVDLWRWRDERYLVRAVNVDDYSAHMRVRSPKWDTVCLSKQDYQELARPFRYFTDVFHAALQTDGAAAT